MKPVSRLLFPSMPVAGALLAGVYRDTRGCDLDEADRVNHFPATPLVSVSLVMQGSLHIVLPNQTWRDAVQNPPLPRLSVVSPQTKPVTSWASGAIQALTIGVYPDAWHSLGGDPEYAKIPASVQTAVEQFTVTPNPATGWQKLCEALGPEWSNKRPTAWSGGNTLSDWVKSITTRAALAGTGQSLRSMERRTKRLSGQTRQALEFFSAMEALQALAYRNQNMPLADIAYEGGFADQSHMGRAVRRTTGISPARLNEAIRTEEAFWCYRLLGERF